jgi:hypothetical protein
MKKFVLIALLAAFAAAPLVTHVDTAYGQSKNVGGGPGNSGPGDKNPPGNDPGGKPPGNPGGG